MNELTELQGSVGYSISALFCLYITIKNWSQDSYQYTRWAWFAIFIIASLAVFEIQHSFRFSMKPYLVDTLLQFTTYAERRSVQAILIVVFFALLTFGVFRFIVAEDTSLGIKIALTGSMASILFFGLAVISLHSIDAIFYAPLLHVHTVCWLWNLCALLIIIGACIEVGLTTTSSSNN